jgi:hypothetical protein
MNTSDQSTSRTNTKKWSADGLRVLKSFRLFQENIKTVQVTIEKAEKAGAESFIHPDTLNELRDLGAASALEYASKMNQLRARLSKHSRDLKISFQEIYTNGSKKTYYLRTIDDVERRMGELNGAAEIVFWPAHYKTNEEWELELENDVKPEVITFRNKMNGLIQKHTTVLS